jgi:NAD-dependent dihydropyrimidine dehydrogenase PreA subunit
MALYERAFSAAFKCGGGAFSPIQIQYPGEVRMPYKVEVDDEKCVGCGECVDVCPVEVFELQDDKSVPVNADECVGCESCIEVCEEKAITVTEM